jgi:hypothetical protein
MRRPALVTHLLKTRALERGVGGEEGAYFCSFFLGHNESIPSFEYLRQREGTRYLACKIEFRLISTQLAQRNQNYQLAGGIALGTAKKDKRVELILRHHGMR